MSALFGISTAILSLGRSKDLPGATQTEEAASAPHFSHVAPMFICLSPSNGLAQAFTLHVPGVSIIAGSCPIYFTCNGAPPFAPVLFCSFRENVPKQWRLEGVEELRRRRAI